jgi:hypothetical protein
LIRYIPMTVWYAYPSHLPGESLHQGEAFWKTTNRYDLAIRWRTSTTAGAGTALSGRNSTGQALALLS